MLGGHAGPHPAPGPPPAAAGAQAPGPPLLPHAVHCKEARGWGLGCTLAPPIAHPPTNQELRQFCDHFSLALSCSPPFGGGRGVWVGTIYSPNSHRTPRQEPRIRPEGEEGVLSWEHREDQEKTQDPHAPYPTLSPPHPTPPHPQTQSKKPTQQAWSRSAPLAPSAWTHR